MCLYGRVQCDGVYTRSEIFSKWLISKSGHLLRYSWAKDRILKLDSVEMILNDKLNHEPHMVYKNAMPRNSGLKCLNILVYSSNKNKIQEHSSVSIFFKCSY